MNNSQTTQCPWQSAPAAVINESFQTLGRMAALPEIWQRAQRVKKGATPSEVVYEQDRLKLLRYLNHEPPKYKTPVVFVFALINRPYILDLVPGKSVIRHFVDAGFDTYMVDWGAPTHADRHQTLETYINGYMRDVMEHVTERTGAEQVNIVGYCMGGTMSAMFTALHPQHVRNLILMAAGIDFETRHGLLNLWAEPEYFDIDAFVDAFGNCPPEFLQTGFLMLKPITNLIEKPIALLERIEDERFVEEYLTMETWLNDNIAIPGEVFREFIKYLYQGNLLVKNRMPIGKRVVNLKRITCPVLNLMAERDDLVPCAQSEPFTDLVGSRDRKTMKISAGHIGLAVGSRAQRDLWPKVCQWLIERSVATRPAARTRR